MANNATQRNASLMHLAFSVEFKVFGCLGFLVRSKCPNQSESYFTKRNGFEMPVTSEHLSDLNAFPEVDDLTEAAPAYWLKSSALATTLRT